MIVKPKPVTINIAAIVRTLVKLINKLIDLCTCKPSLVVRIFDPIISGIVRLGP